MKVDEENGESVGMVNGWARKVQQFSINEFWKNIGCLILAPNFGLGGTRLWEKEDPQNMSGKKRKGFSIRVKLNLYEVSVYPILFNVFFIIL